MADGEQNVKDLLVEQGVDIKWIKTMLSNHLRHHWAVQLVLLTFIGSLIVALLVSLI